MILMSKTTKKSTRKEMSTKDRLQKLKEDHGLSSKPEEPIQKSDPIKEPEPEPVKEIKKKAKTFKLPGDDPSKYRVMLPCVVKISAEVNHDVDNIHLNFGVISTDLKRSRLCGFRKSMGKTLECFVRGVGEPFHHIVGKPLKSGKYAIRIDMDEISFYVGKKVEARVKRSMVGEVEFVASEVSGAIVYEYRFESDK